MKNPSSTPHPLLAGFFDAYAGLLFLGALLGIFTCLFQVPLSSPMPAFIVAGGVILGVIVYHWFYAGKVKFLSFGERVSGKIFKGQDKTWHNPYTANRFFMFLVMTLGLLVIGSTWDGVVRGELMSLKDILIKLVGMFFVLYPMVLMGDGKIKGAFYSFGLFLILTLATFGAHALIPELSDLFKILIWVFAGVAGGYLGVFLFYRGRVKG